MNEIFYKPIIGKCCEDTPEYLVRFNGAPSSDYSVLLCKLHLNKQPFDKNILFVKELNAIEFDNNIKEGKIDA
ncbi:MAG: hypothetical protein K8Q89_09385 [Nitrosarchaeum sp.]|nr:hypothetical protein [Nitrosarchaeum sp.]